MKCRHRKCDNPSRVKYNCEKCSKDFTTKGNLSNHVEKVHTNPKQKNTKTHEKVDYDFCEKSFTNIT